MILLRATAVAARRAKLNRSALIREALRAHLKKLDTRELELRDRKGYEAGPSTLTARFGATGEPLADARGSARSQDRKGVVSRKRELAEPEPGLRPTSRTAGVSKSRSAWPGTRTRKRPPYGRRNDGISVGEVERIGI